VATDANFPASLFNISEADIKIVNGRYTPCTVCHWYTQCTIPKQGNINGSFNFLQSDLQRSFTANQTGRIVYRCLDFTVLKEPTSRGY
jgi:hypothetical protein